MPKRNELLISFVHGYHNDEINVQNTKIPALIRMDADKKEIIAIISLEFPRTPKDFFDFPHEILGEKPLPNQELQFKKLPRFGIMGLSCDQNYIYAASWNGLYKIIKENYNIESFISNRLISDPHGIAVSDDKIYSILTPLDLVVITDKTSGKILDYFSVDRELNINRNESILLHDWRFISKQQRGAVGYWHFNHIRISGDKIYLTSRLTSSIIEIDQGKPSATIRTVCWDTPVMIHDGRLLGGGELVFTSVDGKILIADDATKKTSEMRGMDNTAFHPLMKRDMVTTSIRLENILGKKINWCRGIEEYNGAYITTTDGRYEQEYPYFNITFVKKDGSFVEMVQIPYSLLAFPKQIRYMTGFSVIALT